MEHHFDYTGIGIPPRPMQAMQEELVLPMISMVSILQQASTSTSTSTTSTIVTTPTANATATATATAATTLDGEPCISPQSLTVLDRYSEGCGGSSSSNDYGGSSSSNDHGGGSSSSAGSRSTTGSDGGCY
jgi:uncharacterized membrane protein YgcG